MEIITRERARASSPIRWHLNLVCKLCADWLLERVPLAAARARHLSLVSLKASAGWAFPSVAQEVWVLRVGLLMSLLLQSTSSSISCLATESMHTCIHHHGVILTSPWNPCTLTTHVRMRVSPQNPCTRMRVWPRNPCTPLVASKWASQRCINICTGWKKSAKTINQNYNLSVEQISHPQETNILLDYRGQENHITAKAKIRTSTTVEKGTIGYTWGIVRGTHLAFTENKH
jgi:hypothetical protein